MKKEEVNEALAKPHDKLSKNELKVVTHFEQGGMCAITGKPLPPVEKTHMYDLDRYPTPGADGGRYVYGNVRSVLPSGHQVHTGNVERELKPEWAELREIMAERKTWIRERLKVENSRRMSERRSGELSRTTEMAYDTMVEMAAEAIETFDRRAKDLIKELDDDPVISALLSVKGVGPVAAAALVTTLDRSKAPRISSFWRYAGYAGPSRDRYIKIDGKYPNIGNDVLRTELNKLGTSFLKVAGRVECPYADIYYQKKAELETSDKLVLHKGKTMSMGNVVDKEVPWKEVSPGRRHLAAMRYMMKHFLADLWVVWGRIEGLPIEPPYIIGKDGHSHWVKPEERGWDV